MLPLQTLSNLLAALRESDFSIRARGASGDDPLGAVMLEVNVLASTLHDQRLGALEAGALLRTVMVEIDVAVFTFDGAQTLRLVNRAGERLLGQPAEQLLGRTADELGAARLSRRDDAAHRGRRVPGGSGRWEVRRTTFRQGGRPHQLLVLADVSRPLRDEERQAWQRLIRVIGHEINNSLAPIKSIAGSLESMLARDSMPDDWNEDMQRGLAVIAARSDSLSRFTTAYARLAKLPAPRLDTVAVAALVRRVAGVETRLGVRIDARPDLTVRADPDQLEQLLINLLQNAVDAALETGGGVTVGWTRDGRALRVVDRRRGGGAAERVQSVRAVLHDQAGRIGHRPRPEPADRGSARRRVDAREPHRRSRLPRPPAPATVKKGPGAPPNPPIDPGGGGRRRFRPGPAGFKKRRGGGFRCLAFRHGADIFLQSKSGQPLARYFPELVAALAALPPADLVVDGEIVITRDGHLEFDDLLQRIHPADSRIRRLAQETPATLLVFDLLVNARGTSIVARPLAERRRQLEALFAKLPASAFVQLSPATTSRALAEKWMRELGAGGLDGVVAKRLSLPYRSGERDGMVKIKRMRTADCVVGGFRYAQKGGAVGSLLLGL